MTRRLDADKPTAKLHRRENPRMNLVVDLELPTSRRLIAVAGLVAALWLGWKVAYGELVGPGIVLALLVPLLTGYATGIATDALVAGVVFFGYLVGNRGFAQLNVPGIPLLPGEAALGLGLTFAVWRMAWTKSLFFQRDALNLWLLVWIIVCGVRLPHDMRTHGFVALRDFALVYYGGFFFLAQSWSRNETWRRYLELCLSAGFALAAPVSVLFNLWPEIFARLSVAGVPVIFVKGDVAAGFMAAGVFWFGATFARNKNRWALLMMAICALGAVFSNSRAALLAVLVGFAGLVFLRERRITRALLLIAAVGALCLSIESVWPRSPGARSYGFRLYESLQTVLDISGTHVPVTADLGDKPDNNRFRLVWWEAVLAQTFDEGPLLGLGFGRDLAEQFVRRYYSDNSDEFNTRSPHNFAITVFARTGLLGFGLLMAVFAAAFVRMRRNAKAEPNSGGAAVWLAPVSIFVAACFGVVLEGPMGAAIFWTTLGLANAGSHRAAQSDDSENPILPSAVTQNEVAPTAS